MGRPNFSENFKRDAVHQITVGGYAVPEVSERLGVSTYLLYQLMKLYAKAESQASSVDHEAENCRLKCELARVTEERDILKKAAVALPCRGLQSNLLRGSFVKDVKWSTRLWLRIVPPFRCAGCVVASTSILAGSTHGLRIH